MDRKLWVPRLSHRRARLLHLKDHEATAAEASFFREQLVYLPVLLLAFALRVWALDARSLWFDEAVEYWCASTSLVELPRNVLTVYQPPLYTYLLHAWLSLGVEAIWLRFLSVGLDMLTVVGLMTWAERVFGLRAGVVAGMLASVLPSQVRYAQEVGEYALMGAGLVWALSFLYRALRKPSWKLWGLWGLFSVSALYSHYGAGIVIIPLSSISLVKNLWKRRRQSVLKQTVVSAICLILCLPLLIHFLPRQMPGPTRNASTSLISFWTGLGGHIIGSPSDTFLFQLTGWPFSPTPKWVGDVLLSLILVLSLLTLTSSSNQRIKHLLAWFFLAYLSYFIVVRGGLYGYGSFGFRYGLVLAPLFALTTTAVIEQLVDWGRIVVAIGVLGMTVGLSGYSLPNAPLSRVTRMGQSWPETEELREVTKHWVTHRSGEPTYVYYGAAPAFRYYLRLYGLDGGALQADWYGTYWRAEDTCPHRGGVFFGSWLRHLDSDGMVQAIGQTLGGWPQRLWLVFSHVHSDEDQQILVLLKAMGYAEVLSGTRENASAYLLERE